MLKNTILRLSVLVLLGLNIGVLVNFYSYKKKAALVIHSLRETENNFRPIEKIIKISIVNSDIQLDNISVKDSSNVQIPLKEYFVDRKKYLLVGRFSETNCESCIRHFIKMLKNKVPSPLKKENILFLGDYRNNKLFNKLKVSYGIDTMNVANANGLTIPAEELGYPYFFVIDSTLNILNIFVSDKGSPAIDEKYLDYVQEKFFLN